MPDPATTQSKPTTTQSRPVSTVANSTPNLPIMAEEKVCAVPKYTGEDFAVWKAQNGALLVAKSLGDTIQNDNVDQSKDKIAKAMLLMGLDSKYVIQVLNCQNSREIWMRSSAIHERKSTATRLKLQKQFFDLKLGQNERISN